MNLESVIIRPSPVHAIIKIMVVIILFASLFTAFVFGTDYVEQARAIRFFQVLELDLIAFATFILLVLATVITCITQWAFEVYEVRSDEVIFRKGIFFTSEMRYKLEEVETVTYKQSFLGRLFRYGTITVARPRLKDHFTLRNISDPARQLHLIKNAMGEQKA